MEKEVSMLRSVMLRHLKLDDWTIDDLDSFEQELRIHFKQFIQVADELDVRLSLERLD